MAYSEASLDLIARSMSEHGLLSSIKVRPSKAPGKYELIFGHRRFLAAKRLGWRTIRAEVAETTDDRSIEEALVENVEREDLSDYEKALVFERLNAEFEKTYDQIGEMVGLSKQSISNHIAMLRLFDAEYLSKNPELPTLLRKITEYHARVLARVPDEGTRARLLRMAVNDGLSARDVGKLVTRLRSWFQETGAEGVASPSKSGADAVEKVKEVFRNKFVFAEDIALDKLDSLYLFGRGYSIFPALRDELLEDREAAEYKHFWSKRITSRMSWEIRELNAKILSSTSAVATGRVRFFDEDEQFVLRGSVILVARDDEWKIVHEHWSKGRTDRKAAISVQGRKRALR